MKRLMPLISWTNAWGYCLVFGVALILHAYTLAVMSLACVVLAHRFLLKYESANGNIHRAPTEPHQ